MEKSNTSKKNANAELLRLIAMCMIIMLHALDKGDSLAKIYEGHTVNACIAWFLEALSAPAVNIFMLLSGYYLSKSRFKLGRLIELVAMTLFYSVGALLVCIPLGIDSLKGRSFNDLLYYFFPIHNRLYWFMTVYIVIFLFTPLINRGIAALNKWQHGTVIVMLLIYASVFKSFLPGRFEPDDRGFSFLWLLTVYIIGAYYRNYGFGRITGSTGSGVLLYIICSLCVFAEEVLIQIINGKTGHLMWALEVSYDYNHILLLGSAVGLFAAFMNRREIKEGISRVICALSPMALGIYLAHENLSIRYDWQGWLGVKDILSLNPAVFVLRLLLAVAAVFICGIAIDFIRMKLFDLIASLCKDSAPGRAITDFNRKMNEN